MTVPHRYPSVVLNTLEISIEVCIRVKVQFIVNIKGTCAMMRGGMKVNMTTWTKVTAIITCGAAMMSANTIVETMGGMGGSISLIDIREAVCVRRGDVDMGTMRGSRPRDRRKSRAGSDTRTSGRGVAMMLLMTPFSTVVTGTMKGRPKGL